jgi:hypothetical protein
VIDGACGVGFGGLEGMLAPAGAPEHPEKVNVNTKTVMNVRRRKEFVDFSANALMVPAEPETSGCAAPGNSNKF